MSGAHKSPSHPEHPAPPESWPAARAAAKRLFSPVERFLSVEASSGIVLLLAAVVALVWANSPWRSSYESLLDTSIGLRFGSLSFERDLHFWINDGLMVIFFFVVGLEIRRELHDGELSDVRRAALPVFAALGGMVVPAVIFTILNAGTPAARGWGVPMATDIAFAVGVLALLGKRVPPALRILLLALAVIDDLGAILVIALFYSSGLSLGGLVVAGAGIALIVVMKKLGVRSPWAYIPAAVVTWAGVYVTGVHPTIAGVVIGLLTPVRVVERLQQGLHRWVAFGIMPIFAMANAGVTLGDVHLDAAGRTVLAGVTLGLVLGKPIGVMVFAWLAVRVRLAALPAGISWFGILVVGLVAGIGFTMALFIASLAFPAGPLREIARLGILVASVLAAIIGVCFGRFLPRAIAARLHPPSSHSKSSVRST